MFKTTAALAAAITLCTLTVAAPAGADPTPVTSCAHLPTVIAHRGGNELWTENTLNAFQSAYQQAGVTTWETDVRFDKLGVPVILHDDTVDRTTPATGEIADLQASGTVRIPTDDGQQIPTEWELLHQAQQDGAHVLLELKVMPANSGQWNAFFNRIDITVGAAGVTVTSLDTSILAAVRARRPDLATAWIDESGDPGVSAIKAQGSLYLKMGSSYTAARFQEWHAAGITLYAWTLDDPVADGWTRLVNYPVDGVITTKPVAFTAWLKARCPS